MKTFWCHWEISLNFKNEENIIYLINYLSRYFSWKFINDGFISKWFGDIVKKFPSLLLKFFLMFDTQPC